MIYLPTKGQLADILTKSTPKHVHDVLVPAIMGQHTAYSPLILETLSNMMQEQRKQGKACSIRSRAWHCRHEAELNGMRRKVFCQSYPKLARTVAPDRRKRRRPQRVQQTNKMIEPKETAWDLLSKLTCLVTVTVIFYGRRLVHHALLACCATSTNKRLYRSRHTGRTHKMKRNPARDRSLGSNRWQSNRRRQRTRGSSRPANSNYR